MGASFFALTYSMQELAPMRRSYSGVRSSKSV